MVSMNDLLSLRTQCYLLGISKSGLYYLLRGDSEGNLEIIKEMDMYHKDHSTHGVLQIQDYLFALGFLSIANG